LRISGGSGNDEMAVYFDSAASNSYDENQDAEKMLSGMPGVPNIYSMNSNMRLSINALGSLSSNTEVALGLTITSAANYTISATDFDSFEPSSMLYLEDRSTNTFYNLRAQSSIAFALPAGDLANRFYLHFYLPLQLVAHQETCTGNDGYIEIQNPSGQTWTVEILDSEGAVVQNQTLNNEILNTSALGNGDYTIQLTSYDSYQLTLNASIAASTQLNSSFNLSSNTVYEQDLVQFENTSSLSNVNYQWSFGDGTYAQGSQTVTHIYAQPGIYTVRLIATQDHCEESSTEVIQVLALTTGISEINTNANQIYPNPASEILSISLKGDEEYDWIEIYDLSGRIIRQELITGMNQEQISISVRDIAPGIYVLTLKSDTKMDTHHFSIMR
jgi:PKD repeat protein